MSAQTSTAVAYKRALLDVLEATPELSGIQVGYHPEVGPTARKERIWLGRVEGYTDPASINSGRRRRNEEFLLEVGLRVTGASPKPEENELRASEILAILENLFAADAHLAAVPGTRHVIVVGYEVETVLNGKQPTTFATLRIQVKAHLR